MPLVIGQVFDVDLAEVHRAPFREKDVPWYCCALGIDGGDVPGRG